MVPPMINAAIRNVHAGRTQGAVLLVVVEAPDIFDRIGLRFQLERRKFLGKEEVVQAAEQGLPEGLFKAVGSQQQVQFWLVAGPDAFGFDFGTDAMFPGSDVSLLGQCTG